MYFNRYPHIRMDRHKHRLGVIWWDSAANRGLVSKTTGCLSITIGRLAIYIGKS